MDYQIEIVGVETEELFIQLYRKAMRNVVWSAGIFLLASAWSVWRLADTGKGMYILLLALYVFCAAWSLGAPVRVARKAFSDKLRYYNGVMPITTIRFGEQIRQEDVDSALTIPYDKIKRVEFLKDGIIVYMIHGKTYGFPNRKFTLGSLPELKSLLRAKRPDLKIPD